MRKKCKTCPWTNDNQHNLKFRTYVDKFEKLGKENHKCHSIDGDIWGGKSEINENICLLEKSNPTNNPAYSPYAPEFGYKDIPANPVTLHNQLVMFSIIKS